MATKPSWPVLKMGSTGKNVSALQCLLVYHGQSLTVDGSFGAGTQAALMRFQEKNDFSPDGTAGSITLQGLIVVVAKGRVDYAARAAQYLLSKFESIDIDGGFGVASKSTTETFQQKMDIGVDGCVGPETWQYLFGYDAYPSSGDSGTTSGDGIVYASKCSGASTLTSSQMYANASYIYAYLLNQGFTKNAACGILGNIYWESRANPGMWEGGYLDNPRGGYGLVQWTSSKYATTGIPSPFLVYAADIGLISNQTAVSELDDLATSNPKKLMDAELAHLIESMRPGKGCFYYDPRYDHTGYTKMTYSSFKESDLSADILATIFHDYYERSGDSASAISANRATPAKNYYNTGSFT